MVFDKKAYMKAYWQKPENKEKSRLYARKHYNKKKYSKEYSGKIEKRYNNIFLKGNGNAMKIKLSNNSEWSVQTPEVLTSKNAIEFAKYLISNIEMLERGYFKQPIKGVSGKKQIIERHKLKGEEREEYIKKIIDYRNKGYKDNEIEFHLGKNAGFLQTFKRTGEIPTSKQWKRMVENGSFILTHPPAEKQATQ